MRSKSMYRARDSMMPQFSKHHQFSNVSVTKYDVTEGFVNGIDFAMEATSNLVGRSAVTAVYATDDKVRDT